MMTNAQCGALRHSVFTSRRALLAAALALVPHWGGTPASDAKKKRKKRKHQPKQTCGVAGATPIKGQCCTGAVAEGGVCQACHVCTSGCRFSTVQSAIDAANVGDTIVICPGTYVENLTIARDVRLSGGADASGVSVTTLQGTGTASVVTAKTANVALQRLRI